MRAKTTTITQMATTTKIPTRKTNNNANDKINNDNINNNNVNDKTTTPAPITKMHHHFKPQ